MNIRHLARLGCELNFRFRFTHPGRHRKCLAVRGVNMSYTLTAQRRNLESRPNRLGLWTN